MKIQAPGIREMRVTWFSSNAVGDTQTYSGCTVIDKSVVS